MPVAVPQVLKDIIIKVYRTIPGKKYAFLVLRRIYKPNKRVYQYLQFSDVIEVKIDKQRHFNIRHHGYQLENEIFWEGIFEGWEKYSQRLWYELCQKSGVIFDVGANTGLYSLMAKATNPKSQVFAFEPVDRVFRKLLYNNSLNGYDIHCEKLAASNYNGTAIIYDQATDHTYSVTVNKNMNAQPENSIPVTIQTIRLDTFIDRSGISQLDLLKIDVETHEAEVLEGLGRFLQVYEPTLLIEVLNEDVANGIAELISGINYEFYNIDENTGIRKVSHLTRSDYYNFLICKPEIAEKLEILKQHR